MGRCKDCRYWDKGDCDKVDSSEDKPDPRSTSLFQIVWSVSDDTGLNVGLHTSPEFGCVEFSERLNAL